MSNTSPRFEPYDRLLRQLHQRFGGELIPPSGVESTSATDTDGLWSIDHPAPSLKSAIEGVPLFIEVSGDYLLHIYLSQPSITSFKLRPRGLMDRLLALIGVGGSVKSGNSRFDRRFASDIDARDDSGFLDNPRVQQAILSLVPFVLLKLHTGGIHFSRDVASLNNVTFPRIESAVSSLHQLIMLAKVA